MRKTITSTGFCVSAALLLFLIGCGSAGETPQTPLATLAFAPRMDLPTNGNGSNYLAIADFNGDGKLDIVISGGNAKSVAVFLNNGNGTFSAPVVTTFASQTVDAGGAVVGDFNEDGILDLVVGPVLLLGNGDGTFHLGPALPGSLISNYSGVRTADINGDGHLDLIAAGTYLPLSGNGYVAVSLGNGDGTFRPVNLLPVTSVPGTYDSVVVADFNGDKKLDILACDYGWIYTNGGFGGYPSTLLFYAGNGDGTFQTPVLTTTWRSAGIVANADFTGNGHQDLLITSIDTGIGIPSSDGKDGIVLGNGDGTFQGPQTVIWMPDTESGDGLRTADLDLDGKADILTANRTSGVLTLILNGAIGKVPPSPGIYQFTIAPGLSDIATGDLNGDGLPDVVVSNPTTQQISIFLSQKQ